MPNRIIKVPDQDHPIIIEPPSGRVVVTIEGHVIADSRNALTLREAAYLWVHYIPRADVDMAQLQRSDHRSYCAYKGEANYFSIPIGGDRAANAAWTYEQPFEAVAPIRQYLAFYPGRVDAIVETNGEEH